MPEDLDNKQAIHKLVDAFYSKVVNDELLGPIFNDIAQVDWDHHLPIMYNFWESILIGAHYNRDNPMDAHIKLDQKVKLEEAHFERWLELFYHTIDAHFEGPKAKEVKNRASTIARVMQFKVQSARLSET